MFFKNNICLVCACFLYFFLSYPVLANIKQTANLEEILPEITEDVLVLFDIDDTLVHPTVFVTHRYWKNWLRAQLASLYPSDKEKQSEIYGTANLGINLKAPLTLVNAKTPDLIEKLQLQGVEVFALTMRGQNYWYSYPVPGISKMIANQLREVGIHFDKTRLTHNFSTFPAFENGIIFASAKEKGPFLVELLRNIGYRPSKVVFIDDTLDQVVSVVEALEKEGIPCVGFRYSAASEKAFNLKACALQFKHMVENDVLISNEEAMRREAEQPNVDPMEYFLDFLFNHYEKLKYMHKLKGRPR